MITIDMKYINKQIALEPQTLTLYRNTTPNANYKGFVDTDSLLKQALLNEQGYLCGYCMKKIPEANGKYVSVEHYISQEKHVDSNLTELRHSQSSLRYNNMLAVCVNNGIHCDKSRGNIPFKVLNPHHISCEQRITYSLTDKVESKNNVSVDFDIELLKLNCQNLKELRGFFWLEAKEKLKRKHPKGTWTKQIIETERQIYIDKKAGKYKAFCNYIIFRFNHLLSLPKYSK
ncbi:hypothetical protein HX001_08805 [Empedobacter brevis]|jgi:uncharacterized protein (TIGR02646 family)|uniref:TIGR02646 family protein n=2 Tax=Bacteroidota/Chlorobiota group TaxID=68336 RepID=A0AAJ1V7R1_9FLAO|nr:hypothetical protein [Empedobacter brevis]|tara:strand:+ start:3641 stop:4333 length:693 start_codon:yes stop_codon:yes gene_type:complete